MLGRYRKQDGERHRESPHTPASIALSVTNTNLPRATRVHSSRKTYGLSEILGDQPASFRCYVPRQQISAYTREKNNFIFRAQQTPQPRALPLSTNAKDEKIVDT